jgi:hypothetical protein
MSLFASCTSGEQDLDLAPDAQDVQKAGAIVLSLNADARFSEQTRAVTEADYRNTSNYTVQVYNNDKPAELLVNCKYSELDNNMPSSFDPGTYTVKAFYGTEHNYSRNDFYVEGIKNNVTVTAGNSTIVTMNCTPTCGKLSVQFDSEMATYYDSYDVSFTQAQALNGSAISWTATDTEPWYVKLAAEGETLRYTINLTAKDEYAYTDAQGNKKTTGTVTKEFNLQRNRAYKLKIKPDYTAMTEGGLSVIIEFDEDTNPIDIPVVVPVDWL